MIRIKVTNDTKKLNNYFQKLLSNVNLSILDKYGREGVAMLSSATPVDSGETAASWYYEIERSKDSVKLIFKNSNVNDGCNIAILLQYGHATNNGGYVSGIDYINPALKRVFEQLANEAWKELTN